jgi:hypothetical protein
MSRRIYDGNISQKEGLRLARPYLFGLVAEIMRTGGGAKTREAP